MANPGPDVAAEVPDAPRSATTLQDEIARLDQALEDLHTCEATSVSLIHCPNPTSEKELVRELAGRARYRRFVTVEVSLREHPLHSPDGLLRDLLERLVPPNDNQPRGLIWLLDVFSERYGQNSAARFGELAEKEHAEGDLASLCQAYLGADDDEAEPEIRAYMAWRDGTEPAKKYRNPNVRRALNERTAHRALSELTRIVRALGHRGLVIFLSEGDAISGRTERQREKAYTVLRELVDNFDGTHGAVATRVVLTGQDALFEGAHSVRSLAPLRMRLEVPSDAEPPPPHRAWTTLVKEPYEWVRRGITTAPDRRAKALRNLIRISEGLPPTEDVASTSVGTEKIDKTVRRLFEHVDMAGSVFSVVVGDYGTGKTHLMMHLAERALDDDRPVFWLNLERTNLDLGNPARHLARLLEHSEIPIRRRPSARELASRWTRGQKPMRALEEALEAIAATDSEEAHAAKKALRIAAHADAQGRAIENFLSAADLEDKPAGASYRRDAYRRILLWLELLGRLEGTRGPVLLIDEAENLYTSGRPWAARRTSLRSLAFYCGGALPESCVLMAMTPPAFEDLKKEARDLLDEADHMESTLELEDVGLFRRRLWGLKPDPVPTLSRPQRAELCERVRRAHRSVRGAVPTDDWETHVKRLVRNHESPRTLIRTLVDELEAAWWAGD